MPAFDDRYRVFHERDGMMGEIRQYLLALVAAALVCGVVKKLVAGKKQIKGMVDMICGIFLAVTVLSPWVDVQIPDVRSFAQTFINEGNEAAQEGSDRASEQMHGIIKQEVQTYILEKAHARNMNIDVDVILDVDSGIPYGVKITGDVSPYDKAVLSQYITQTLSIPEEAQKWE